MNLLVVDASVAAKWFVEEEHSGAALSVLDISNRLHAPDFLWLEMENVIWKWIRQGMVTTKEGSDLKNSFRRYPIRIHPFVHFLDSAFAIAVQTRQTVYDCLYVALAILLKGRMITADRRLHDALRKSTYRKQVVWVENFK